MDNPRIRQIEWGRLEGWRPRKAGSNARLGEHGSVVRPGIARITTEDGASGFGYSFATRELAASLIGARLRDLFAPETGFSCAALEYPLWDLIGQRAGQPVYRLAAGIVGATPLAPYRVRCYDTSLYFDDLHLESDDAAAALMADEAREGYERGHRAFKIKVGRGARWMPLQAGTRRDIAIVRAVRAAVGPGLPIMLDANNGYNLNLTKHVLFETAECEVYWMEEAFHEDRVLYLDLRQWMAAHDLSVLIADGEGAAAPSLLDWARDRVVDVVQYDIFDHGFTVWLTTGGHLDAWGVASAPHHYGGAYGNYAACHLAAAIRGFAFAEWDEVALAGLDASGYSIGEGWVTVPEAPGFGLGLDDAFFRRAVAEGGYVVF